MLFTEWAQVLIVGIVPLTPTALHIANACTGKSADLPAAECAAWLSFYDGFTGWATDCNRSNPCGWTSPGMGAPIQCQGGGDTVHIAAISMNDMSFNRGGTISSSIGELSELTWFRALGVGIIGTIPAEMIKLKKLTTLNLMDNSLHGVVPPLPFSQYSGCDLAEQTGAGFDCPLPPGASTCNQPGPPWPLNCTPTPPPTLMPTPVPSPLVMYSCNAATGQCAKDPRGTQSPGECINTCKCVTPHNCGQLNGTVGCKKDITGCNVCDACCKPWITVQASCDGCFAAPAGPYGCGNRTSAG